mmetsp:Transcript_9295/g.13979  ORF Transcript_9295/g.13979 Transcript_9295/m.13979 type:complete len:224 (-) Transcript_9295:967-1638(-)
MRDTPSGTLNRPKIASALLSANNASSDSVPLTEITVRMAPSGKSTFPPAKQYSSKSTIATELGSGFCLKVSMGAITPTPTSSNLRRAVRATLSSADGISLNRIESTVATSLKGIPTANLQPNFLYSRSGLLNSERSTCASTDPSRWRKPLTSILSLSLCQGRSPLLLEKDSKLRFVSTKVGTLLQASTSLALARPIPANVRQGSISNSGSSVSETLIVSPRPS